ncbi:LacI family DNA-binding transcriptional regulator [Pelagibacterium xiamenense]|uniref:LacI family DNA-binding transcriptional regulator n=1 Tax=Pelagibacterium xiamenense TaxID=2901140 RepID=UPI001E5086DE|nr:LacI family DNA-binding transcriptional regulator [Pelagibacterium xiamenense]MCD7058287.1 LacI family DNA-binding transcriptional regulator [Pelagibacterium xiamenense]
MATATFGKTVRLADVAAKAGVSQGTVSNVFNRPDLVREEVRERVREVARAMGYIGPDPRGRLLRAGKVHAIGVATMEPLSYFFADPFARVLMTGITEASQARGAGVSLVSAEDPKELAWNLRSALVDGFILFCIDGAPDLLELSRERQLPFVALSLSLDDDISAVGIDNAEGAAQAARHLADLGHRDFAVLAMALADGEGPVTREQIAATVYTSTRDRLGGYFDALAPYGIDTARIPVFETQVDPGTVHRTLEAIFSAPRPPTALLAQSDWIALTAIEWLKSRGIRVPEDVSIVGFDGVPEAATSSPPLTTIAQPIADIGRTAARIIIEDDGAVHRKALATELVVRGSTAPPKRLAD